MSSAYSRLNKKSFGALKRLICAITMYEGSSRTAYSIETFSGDGEEHLTPVEL